MEQSINRLAISKDQWIKEVYELLSYWIDSGLTAIAFQKIVNISSHAFYEWKNKFTPGHPNADEHWMKVGGVINYQPLTKRRSISELRKRWLDYCAELKTR